MDEPISTVERTRKSSKRSREVVEEEEEEDDDIDDPTARFEATSRSAKRPRTVEAYDGRMKSLLKWAQINCVEAVDSSKPRGVDVSKLSIENLRAFFGYISVWHEGERLNGNEVGDKKTYSVIESYTSALKKGIYAEQKVDFPKDFQISLADFVKGVYLNRCLKIIYCL